MKQLAQLKTDVRGNKELRELAMNMMQDLYTQTQENLVSPMPWGDNEHMSDRRPSVISDQSLILQSGIPPYWESDSRIVFRYDAPHSEYCEYGTDPHPVAASHLIGWVNRKLNIHDKRALGIAYAIATNIRKEGMDPHPFIRPAIEQISREYKMFRIRVEH